MATCVGCGNWALSGAICQLCIREGAAPGAEQAGAFEREDLRTLAGMEMPTPTYLASQTKLRFRGSTQTPHKIEGLYFTEYFNMPNVDGYKCHFTVTLKITRVNIHSNMLDVRWNNPHLTVRKNANCKHGITYATPGVHLNCIADRSGGGSWSSCQGIDDTSAFPDFNQAHLMHQRFIAALQTFLYTVNSCQHDPHLS